MRPSIVLACALFTAELTVGAPSQAQVSTSGTPARVVQLPETPAGRAAREWLEAFNAADSARLHAWTTQYSFAYPLGAQLMFRRQTGGFDLVSVETSEPRRVE